MGRDGWVRARWAAASGAHHLDRIAWIAVSTSRSQENHVCTHTPTSLNPTHPSLNEGVRATAHHCPHKPPLMRMSCAEENGQSRTPGNLCSPPKGVSSQLFGSTHFRVPTPNFGLNFGQLPPRVTAQPFGHSRNVPTGSQQSTHSPPTPALGQPLGWGHANQGCLANERGAPDRKPDMSGRSNRGRRVGTP